MCRKLVFILTLSLCPVTSAGAQTITWDFENGNDHFFFLWSLVSAAAWTDDPNIAGDESITGVGGHTGLPDAGIAWSIGTPNQYDGLKPAVEDGARVNASGLLEYSLGPEVIPTASGTLNTFSLNQDGGRLHIPSNDQIATSPMVLLGEDSVLTVWSHGGGSGTHAPEYDPDPDLFYSDGSSGIAVLSAEEEDKYAILATVHTQGKGTLTEDTLDLSAFAGRKVFIEVVDAFDGDWGWLAIDKIEITNAICKIAGFVANLANDEATSGFDAPQIDHLEMLGYNVLVINQNDITSGVFTKADANALDVLIVSETPSSSNTVLLSGTSTPVLHEEAYGWVREWAMATRTAVNWFEGDNTNIDIVNDAHPVIANAGLSIGSMPFFNVANHWTSELVSAVAPGAEILAQITQDSNDYAIVFAIEKGGELADGTAAASRIVGLSIPGEGSYESDALTDEVWAMFDAAIAWLDPAPVEPVDPGADGLTAAYYFETDASDSSGNGYDGRFLGDAYVADGVLVLDGDDDAVAIPGIGEGLTEFTFSMMVYPTVDVVPLQFCGGINTDTWGGGVHLKLNYGTVNVGVEPFGPDVVGTSLAQPNTWTHLALTVSPEEVAVYFNGEKEGSRIVETELAVNVGAATIGAWNNSGTDVQREMTGMMDNVLIYDRALSEAEILYLANN